MFRRKFTLFFIICAYLFFPGNGNGFQDNNLENGFYVTNLPVFLEGEWEASYLSGPIQPEEVNRARLTWQKIHVPGSWKPVFGDSLPALVIYRTYLYIPRKFRDMSLGIGFYRIRDVDRVYLNNVVIGQTGEFPDSFQKANLHPRVYDLPESYIQYDGWNTLEVWVYSEARDGGLVDRTPIVDRYRSLLADFQAYGLWILVFIIVFVFSAFHHILLSLYQKTEIVHVYRTYGVLCLLYAIYLWTFNPLIYPVTLSYNLLFRLNVSLFLLNITFFVLFVFQYFRENIRTFLKLGLSIPVFLAVHALLISPRANLYRNVVAGEGMIAVLLPFIIHVMYKKIRDRFPHALLLSGILGFFLLTVIYDIGNDMGWLPHPVIHIAGMVSPFGFMGVYLGFGFILAIRFGRNESLATYDSLTGLLQRRAFMDALERYLAECRREGRYLVTVMIDVDNFKAFNDRYSHALGDRILTTLGKIIRRNIRGTDIAGRLGGDEFAIAFKVRHRTEAVQIIERIRKNTENLQVKSGTHNIQVRMSMGVAWGLPRERLKTEEVLYVADHALLKAKRQGKNTMVWMPLDYDRGSLPFASISS